MYKLPKLSLLFPYSVKGSEKDVLLALTLDQFVNIFLNLLSNFIV